MGFEDRTCPRCGKVFRYPSDLKPHLARKNPCKPKPQPQPQPQLQESNDSETESSGDENPADERLAQRTRALRLEDTGNALPSLPSGCQEQSRGFEHLVRQQTPAQVPPMKQSALAGEHLQARQQLWGGFDLAQQKNYSERLTPQLSLGAPPQTNLGGRLTKQRDATKEQLWRPQPSPQQPLQTSLQSLQHSVQQPLPVSKPIFNSRVSEAKLPVPQPTPYSTQQPYQLPSRPTMQQPMQQSLERPQLENARSVQTRQLQLLTAVLQQQNGLRQLVLSIQQQLDIVQGLLKGQHPPKVHDNINRKEAGGIPIKNTANEEPSEQSQ